MKKLFLILILFSFSSFGFSQSWQVPTKYKTMKSTVNLKDTKTINEGKELWNKHCKSCHGSKGLGDGVKSSSLKTFSGDFSIVKFQNQTDGEIFYKTVFGKDEMPNYDKKIPDVNDQWSLVSYMRTLKK